MTNEKIDKSLNPVLKGIPGVIGMIIINQDGIPIYFNGRFDINLHKLSGYLAVCGATFKQVGKLFSQEVNTILTEYKKLKIYQIKITSEYSLVIMFKIKDAYLGEIMRNINKAVEEIGSLLPKKIPQNS